MKRQKNQERTGVNETKPVRKLDLLWWIVIYVPILWWMAMLVLVLLQQIGWQIFISTGFIVQGCLYGLQAVLRMLIKPLGRGYAKGHHIAFLIAGLFWAVLGIILIFVTKGL
ncbi:hypothetical protein GF359_02190 [candidate division WOR-3 bacterium]|uniref:Uncharacterized protein n=1 Tax=candidate division WOR-3 bacterium TaxID=2052148 RepID=A0A9D5QBV7_UNCW3|nr:hypothetical protein [candidate division WOR-3 bacterium]MBD3364003.1 hypothetical protein [candidate division WOR-3 bacterium]